MKIRTTTARRQQVVGILAPQLHTLRHAGTGKLLKFVALPNSPHADRVRMMTAEALCDLLEENKLLVVHKPDVTDPADGQQLDVDLEAADLTDPPAPAPVQHQRVYKRMRPGETIDQTISDNDDAPAIFTDEMPEDTVQAAVARSVAGVKPSDSAREAFERLGARMRAEHFVTKIIGPLLQRMRCSVYITDNSERQPDGQATNMTILVELPREAVGA